MVVLAVTWVSKAGNEKQVAESFAKLEAASRQEPGCLLYVVHRHSTNPAQFFIYEQYRDDAALQAHRDSPHFQQYVLGELKETAERVQGDLYVPLTE